MANLKENDVSMLGVIRSRNGWLTISVASTRVPTIFSLTFVFFSMICSENAVSKEGPKKEIMVRIDLFIRGE